jgi:chromosome segregation ATPase
VKLENFQDEKETFANSSKARLNELNSEIEALEKRNTSAEKLQKRKKERSRLKQKISRFPKREERFLKKNTDNCKRLREKIKEIEAAINLEPRELSRLQSILEGEYRKLNFMPKAYLDCTKIFVRNIIYHMLKQFRPLYNNFRNDIVILRELIEASGYIEESDSSITVYLYPPRHYPESVRSVIIRFLLKISYEINCTYKLDKTIILDIYSAKK